MKIKSGRSGMNILCAAVLLTLSFAIAGCGCDEENPTVALANNGTAKADIQIKTSGGNTENINNIDPGTVTERRGFSPGDIEFTVSIQGVNDPVVYILDADYCHEYSVIIREDNSVGSFGREVK